MTDVPSNNTPKDKQLPDENLQQGGKQKAKLSAGQEAELKSENDKAQESFKQREERLAREVKSAPERHSRPDENEPEGWDVSSDAELPQEADAKSEGSFSSGSTPLAQDAISDSADSVALPFSPAVSENTGIQLATDQWTQLPLRDGITQDSLPKLLAVWEMFGEAIEDVNDSNPLSYSSDAQVSGFNLHADGSYAFDPSHSAYQHLLNGQSHQLIIPVTVTNNHGVSGTLNLSLSLVGWNNEPVLQQAAVSIREDASLLAGQLQAKDIDTGDSLVFSTRAQVDGFSLNADGSYTFDPSHAAYQSLSENQPLVLKIPVMVTDGHGGTATSDLSITVIGTNDGPVLQQAAVTTREDANLLTGQLQATDVDNGDTLVFSIAAPVDGFSFNADGSYSFDPAHSAYQYLSANQPLMVKVPVTVTDSQGAVETCDVLITVIGTNDGPVLQQAAISTREDASLLTGQLQAVDTDTRDTLLFTTTTPVDGFTLNADGSYTFDPSHAAYQSLAAGQPMIQTIEVSVGDGHGGVDRQQLTITLIGTDDAPKLGTLQVLEVKEDSGVIRDRIAVSDVDQHETLLFSVASPQDGFVLYPDGSWKFDPSHPAFQHLADGEVKELRIPVTVTDHSGLSDTQILLIHVTGTNDQPSITTQAPPLNLHEGDARVEGDFSAIDRDSTDVLTFTTPAPIPGFAIDQRGHWSFDPTDPAYNKMPAGDVKKLNIPVIVEDGHGGSDQRVLHIVLNGTNDKPEVQVTPLRNVQEDHLVHDRLVSSDPDSGDTRTFSVPGHVDGFTLTADGSYSFDASHPAYQLLRQDEVKDVMVPVIVTDRQGAQSWTTLTFRLHGTNDVPVVGGISHAIGALDTAVGGTLRVAGELTVVDADSSESSFQAQLLHGSYGVLAITPDGHWSYTADAHQSALHSLSGSQHLPETFTVLTKDGTSHEIKLEIRGDNTPAIFGNVLSGTVKEDVINSVTAKATLIDPDTGENHFQAVDQNTAHGHITMDSDGTWTYTLNRGDPEVQALAEGTSLTERILIGSADGTPHFLTVLVAGTNDAPLISGVSSGAVQEDVGSGSVSATLTGNDPDTGDVLTWSLEGSGQGTYGSLSLDTATGTWTYQIDNSLPAVNELAAGDSQPDTFVVMLTDKLGAVTRHDITVTVNGSNDAPVITATAVVSGGVTEDNTANTVSGSLTATDADSGASLTWSLDSTDGTYGTIAIDPDTGRWTYTLDNHRAGTQALAGGHTEQDTFIATVTDEHGELVRHTITIDVTGNNDVAVIKGVDTGSITEDALAGRTKTLYAGGQLTITDVDAGEAQFQPATAPGDQGYGSFSLLADGSWTYLADNSNPAIQKLAAHQQVTDSITVQSADGTQHTITVTLQGTNDGPILSNAVSAQTVDQDQAFSFALPTDTFADIDTGDSLTLSATNLPAWLSFDAATGTFSGTPTNGDVGQVQVTVTATDSQGAHTRASFELTVNNINDAPSLAPVSRVSVNEDGQRATGQLTATDPDAVDTQTYSTTATVPGFTLNRDGSWSFDPTDAAYQSLPDGQTSAPLVIPITVTDAAGATDTQDLTITVTGTNDGAVISGVDTGSITEDALAGRTKTLYAGGQLTITDVDAGEAQFQPATAPGDQGYGSFSLLADGSWTYLADNSNPAIQKLAAHQQVTDSITVQSADGTQHTITVTLQGTNDGPILSNAVSAQTVDQDQAFSFALPTDTFADIDTGDSLTLSATNLPAWLSFDAATGTFSGTPTNRDVGQVQLTVTATDSQGAHTRASFELTVNNINDAPSLAPVSRVSVNEDGQRATGQLTATDPDAVDTQTYSTTATVPGFTLNRDGSWSFDPTDAAYQSLPDGQTSAPLVIPITVTDAAGATDTQDLTITVTGTNDGAVISGVDTGSITEDTLAGRTKTLYAGGQLTITDVDAGEAQFQPATAPGDQGYGSFSLLADGSWTYLADNSNPAIQKLAAHQQVTDSITVQSADGTQHIVTVTIIGTNDAPIISKTLTPVSINETDALNFRVPANAFTDIDGDHITLSATLADGSPLPSWLHFNPATQTFTGHPDHADDGSVSVRISAVDPSGAEAHQNFSLTVVDNVAPNAPTLNPLNPNNPGIPYIATGTPTFTGTAEPGSLISILDGTRVLGTVTADDKGHFTFQPTQPLTDGDHAFSITATDTAGNQSSASAPLPTTVDTQTRPELQIDSIDNSLEVHHDTTGSHPVHGANHPGHSAHWASNAVEVTSGDVTIHGVSTGVTDGSTVTVHLVDKLNNANTFDLTTTVTGGQWSVTVPHTQIDKVGTHDWQVEVSAADLFGNTVHTTTEIIDEDGLSKTLSENGAAANLDLLGDNDGIQVGQVLYSNDGVHFSSQLPAGVALDADGHTLQIDPANPAFDHLTPNDEAKVYVRYLLTETVGSASEHIFQSAVVTVTGSNDVPVVTATDVAHAADIGAIDEDSSKTFTTAELLNLVGASDADGDRLSISAVNIDSQYGGFTQQGDHWLFTPAANVHHDDIPITVQVSDGTAETEAHAILDLTSVTDAAQVSLDILAEQSVVNFSGTEAGSAEIKNIPNAQTLNALAVELTVVGDAQPAENGLMFALSTNDLQQVLNIGGFCVTKPQNLTILFGNGTTYETHINMNADPGSHRWSILWNGDSGTLDILKDGQPIWHGDNVEKGYSLEANDAVATMGNIAYRDDYFDPNNDWKGEIFDLSVATTLVNPAALANAPLRDVAHTSDLMLDVRVQGGQIVDSARHSPITLTGAVSTVEAMVDTHVIPPNPGALLHLSPTITTQDPYDQVTGIHIGGFAAGTVLDDGQGHHHTITGPTERVNISGWTLGGLTAQLPQGDTSNMRVTLNVETTGPDGTLALSDFSAAVILDPTAPVPDATVGGEDTKATDEDTAVSGDLTVSDADASQAHFTIQHDVDGNYGKFNVDADGHWSYAPDNRADHLAAGAHESETFTVTTTDGTTHEVVINLTGTDDPGRLIASTPHPADLAQPDKASGGVFKVVDIDNPNLSAIRQENTAGHYGTFKIGTGGVWFYQVDPTTPDSQQLGNGQTAQEHFTVEYSDGSQHTLTVDILGTSHGPTVISQEVNLGKMTEDTSHSFSETELLQMFGASTDAGADLHVTDITIDPQYGSFSHESDGSWTFHPAANVSGDHIPFTITVGDGTASTTGVGALAVTNIQDAPTVSITPLSTDEDTPYSFSAADFGFTDADAGDTLNHVTITGLPSVAEGQLLLDGSAVTANQQIDVADIPKLVFQPTADFNGDVAFKYTVNDGHADSAEATGNLSVQAVDDVVMVTATDGAHAADLGSTAEDTAKTFSEAQLLQLVGAHDVDGDTLHVSTVAVDAAAGTFAKNPDGSWTFTPTANFDVSHLPVTIEVTDGNGITPAYALMDISPVADTPTLDISLGGKIILTPVASLATEMGVSTGQTFLGSTFVDFNGFYDKPVLYGSAEDLAHVTAIKAGGETLHLGAEVHDPEHGTGREIVGNWNIRAFVDNSGDGSVKLVVDDTAPTQMTFSMHYTDGEEFVTDVADWADFTVDRTPTTGGSPSNNFSATIDEDTPLPLYLTVADPDTSEQLTITISGLPAGATLNAGTDNHDGSWTLSPEQLSGLQMTPAANWNGEINLAITVTSTDGSSHADTTSNLKIAVNPVEDLSTVSGEDLRDVTEGVNAGHHDLTVNVVEGYHNKFTGHTLAPVTLGDTATGQIFIPIGGLDSSGIQFQVAGFSDSLLVRYGHHFVNLGNPDYGFHGYAVVADNDKALSITASYSGLGAQSEIGGDLHIQDVDTPAATFVEVNGAAGDQGYGQFSMHNGHWTFVPGPNAEALPDGQKATETFTFHTSDGTEHQVVINLTGSDSESRFTGSLSGTIQSSAELTAQDQASGSLGIFDPDAGTTQPTLPDITSQAGDNGYGHFSLQDGHWTYTPDEAAVAPLTIHEHVQDSLTIHASDGREVVITVDITGSNSAPTVSGSVHLSNLGDESPVTITEAQLLSHASDIDLDANESLSVSGVTVDHGSITHHNDGTWTFTPEQGYTGSVQFSYQVEDQHHGVTHASAELTIVDNDLVPTVTATDSAHAADLGNTAEDTTMTFTEADLLSKVGAHDSDATDTLSISDITSPHGSFTKLATGDWEFTPEANYHGDDVAVSIQVSDGSLSTTAQAIIDITSVTDAPIISASVTGVSTITRQVETPVQSLVETATGTTDTPLDLSYLEASGTDGMLGNTVAFTVPSGVDNHCITGLLIDGQLVSGDPVYCGLYDSNNQDTVVFPDLDVATFMNARNITFQFADNAPAELDIKITYDWGAIGWSETETGLLMQEAGSLHIDRHGTVMEMRETEIMASPEDSPISLDIDVQAAAADDQLVSIVMTGIPDGATLSAGSHNADGSWTLAPADLAGLTLTPAQDWRGDIDLQIVAKTSDGTQEAEQSSTLSVTVAPVADVPTVTVSAVRNDEDSTFDLDIQLGGHFDAHESQSIEISGIPVGSSLSAGTSRADGVWVLTPQELPNLSLTLPKDYETSLTLDVKGVATDEGGVTGSQTVQMSVEVNPLEDAPDVRLTSTPEFNEDTSYTFQPSDFGFHDVDSADSLHHVTLTQLPASGVLLLNGQAVTTGQQIDAADIPHLVFQPTQDFQGQLSLGFTVNDGQLDSAESVMRLDVINVNDAATFTGDKTGSMTDDKDALATISGQLTVHDIDSDHRITVHSYTGVETYQGSNGWGSLKIDPDGNWEYTLNDHTMELPEGKVVTDSVTVHSVDGTPQVITVTITGTNQAPIAGATVHLPDETSGTPFTISEEALLATAHDVDLQAGEELSVHNLHAGFSSVTDNGDGTFTITPQSGYTGEIQISFEVHDPQGGVVQSLALLDILPSPTITDVASSSDTVASQSDTTALPEPPLHDYMQYASMDDSGLMESAPAEVAHLEDYLDLAGVAASDILQPVDVPMAPDIDGLDSTASDSLPGHQDAQDLIDSMPVDWSVDHYIDDSQHHGG